MNAKKYKSNQAGHILHHSWKNWERKLNNETIDKSKNKLNYQIFNSVRSGEPLKAEHIQQ
nr:hypothetical protein [Enterococcus sp.]